MTDTTREHKLEALIIDLTSGYMRNWYDIQAATGYSEEKSREMEAEISDVFNVYKERNNL